MQYYCTLLEGLLGLSAQSWTHIGLAD